MRDVRVERLDHQGLVAGICREIGLAEDVDTLAGPSQQHVSVGTATVAMILNGLGFSNRRLYLVAQFFATKPVDYLLGPGVTAEQLYDDCLGRTLDWLYAHDLTALFAGIARQARQRFGIAARQVHVDTTSFAVTGEYDTELDAQPLAVTYGYSRDHRADLKQWMLALATTRQGDVPLFCQALDGNASDKESLVKACPAWLRVESVLAMQPKHRRPGRPRKDAPPDHVEWQVLTTLTVDAAAVAREARRKAAFVVATNVLEPAQLSDQELIRTYKEQHSVERGFGFLKDPLFLASSVFVKKPERIVALSLAMVLCLLVYRLAEHRLREQLAATGQTVHNQLKQPTDRPTMRWIFQCFEGVSLVTFQPPHGPPRQHLAHLEPLHDRVATLLGPFCKKLYKVAD